MKIIHSYWSKPNLISNKSNLEDRSAGGWREKKYNYYSWTLSCLKAIEHYNSVELITDRAGKEILIDILKLPYTSVRIELDQLNRYPSEFWAIGKIYSYSIQKVPFIHIDGDVYLWKRLNKLEKSPLIAQTYEHNHYYYHDALNMIKQYCDLPKIVKSQDQKILHSSNAGIIGGQDVDFFKRFSGFAFNYIDSNINCLMKSKNPGLLNVIFEQFFFHCLASNENIFITYLNDKYSSGRKELYNFSQTPFRNKFVHIQGKEPKRDISTIEGLESTLRVEYPKYYHRINILLKEFKLV